MLYGIRPQETAMAQRFEGSFQVQNDDFELDARAVIVRDDGIAFEL